MEASAPNPDEIAGKPKVEETPEQKLRAWVTEVVAYGTKANSTLMATMGYTQQYKIFPDTDYQAFREMLGGLADHAAGIDAEKFKALAKSVALLQAQNIKKSYDDDIVLAELKKMTDLVAQ